MTNQQFARPRSEPADVLRQRLGIITLNDDGVTDNLATLNAALAKYKYVEVVPASGGAGVGVIGLSGSPTFPANTTLSSSHRGVDFKLLATGSNEARGVFDLKADGVEVYVAGGLDGNLTGREATGEFTGFVWGVRSINCSNTRAEIDTVKNVGATAVYIASNDGQSDGGAALMSMDRDAVASMRGNYHEVNHIEGTAHGFMSRIRSDFNGWAESDSPYYVEHNETHVPIGRGGTKNCVEVVGPNTRFNDVYGGTAIDPTGVGGYEQDFGAYDNTFHDPAIHFTQPIAQSFDCFNNRTSDQGDGKLKVSRRAHFVRPRLLVDAAATLGANLIFRVCTVWNVGTDVKFDDLKVHGNIPAGTGAGYSVLLACNAGLAKIDRVQLNRPRVGSVQRGIYLLGSFNHGLIEQIGGDVTYVDNHLVVSGTTVDHFRCKGAVLSGTATAIPLSSVTVADVDDNEFRGQTANTIQPNTAYRSVLRFGGNAFYCGATTGNPVGGQGATGLGYTIDRGGNYYTTRVNAGPTTGSQGRAMASAANSVTPTLGSRPAEMRARVFATARPSVGLWEQFDTWEQPNGGSATLIGEECTSSGYYGTYASTADTTNGSNVITVASAAGLRVGEWITVTGAIGRARVESIVGTTVTLRSTDTASATLSGANVAHIAPVWKSLGMLGV